MTTRDSSVSFCAPPSIVRLGSSRLWVPQRASDANEEGVSFRVLDAIEIIDNSPWPPSLLRDSTLSCVDCLDVDNDFRVHWDDVGGQLVRVETARVSGGFAGWHNQPWLVAAWPTAEGEWVLVEARARTMAGLDTVRMMIRSARVELPRCQRLRRERGTCRQAPSSSPATELLRPTRKDRAQC